MTKTPTFSYEFFPPRTLPMQRRFWRAVGQLERINPEFFSMTYGALGSAKQISIDTTLAMSDESPIPVAAHLTCSDSTADEIESVTRQLGEAGIERIVALRGDSDAENNRYAYSSTIEFIHRIKQIGDFDISVAAYPEVHPLAKSAAQDLQHLKAKFDAGANRAITQFFFEAESFLRFRDRARAIGIENPIVPGILPILDFDKVKNFSSRCGASLPAYLEPAFTKYKGDLQACYNLSRDLSIVLCDTLLDEGVDQFHLYTLNQTDICLDISLALGAEVTAKKVLDAA
ncbi:MAG: 5,10-methylenetetrahydrofolate reductase [Gammaproteobacteria bacterium]|nr:5,10-methylenetetrahydrofolate reductase [Gammaproteobacteria bacterium]